MNSGVYSDDSSASNVCNQKATEELVFCILTRHSHLDDLFLVKSKKNIAPFSFSSQYQFETGA